MEQEIEKMASLYKKIKTEIKELTENKLELEEKVKDFMEKKKLTKIQFSNCSLIFNTYEKLSSVSNSLTLETCYNKILENEYVSKYADEILDSVREELDKNKKTTIVRTLRIKDD